MAQTPLTDEEIEVGKPTKKRLFTKIKDNNEDHETRLNGLEEGAGKVIVCDFEVIGFISHYSPSELVSVATFRAPANFNLLELVITIIDSANGFDSAGVPVSSSSAGVLEVGLLKSTDGGATFNSILTTNPQVVDGKNGKGESSNSTGNTPVIFNDTAVVQDNLLKIDIQNMKDTQGTFHISCYGSLD